MPDVSRKRSEKIIASPNAPADLPLLQIKPPRDYMVVPSSSQTLLCGLGQAGERPVLVPYVQTQLLQAVDLEDSRGKDLKFEPAFQATLAFENLAFLILDLSRDYEHNTTLLAALSTGELHAEPWRLNYAAACLQSAVEALENTAAGLKALVADAEAAARPPRTQSKPKPRAKPKSAAPARTAPSSKRAKPR